MVNRLDLKKEIERITQLINENPDDADNYFNRAIYLSNVGKHKEAIIDYTKAIEKDKDSSDFYILRGYEYYNNQDYSKAIDDFTTTIEKSNDTDAYICRASTYSKLEKYNEAIDDYTKAIEKKNKNTNYYIRRANTYIKIQKYSKAINDCNKALEININDAEVYDLRASIYSILKMHNEAILDYTNAITKGKNSFDSYYKRGNEYYDLEEYDKAIDDYNIGVELNKYSTAIYRQRGMSYYMLDKYDKVIENCNLSIEISNNKNTEQANYFDFYLRASSYNILKKYDKAISDYKQSIKINPNDISIYSDLGFIYLKRKQWKLAARYFVNAKMDLLNLLNKLIKIKETRPTFSKMIDLEKDNFFNRTTPSLCKSKKKVCKDIYITILELINQLYINDKNELTFSHYTKKSTASQLLFNQSPFRLNSTITCNDPEEGETILKYLAIDLEKNETEKEHSYQAFIGCFTFNRESLNQFRLYGKEDNKEATGVSLEIKKEFFDEEIGVPLLSKMRQPITSQLLKSENDITEKDKEKNKKYALYRCIYLDPETKRVISVGHKEEYAFYRENSSCSPKTIKEYKESINKVIEDVNKKLEELRTLIDKAKGTKNENLHIICELLLPLRYLVKHVAFKEEQECRIFDVKDLSEDKKKNEKEKEIQFTPDFMQMYIEYQPIKKEELKRVVFAPKAEKIEVFNEALIQNGFEIQGNRSTLPFA